MISFGLPVCTFGPLQEKFGGLRDGYYIQAPKGGIAICGSEFVGPVVGFPVASLPGALLCSGLPGRLPRVPGGESWRMWFDRCISTRSREEARYQKTYFMDKAIQAKKEQRATLHPWIATPLARDCGRNAPRRRQSLPKQAYDYILLL